MKINYVMFDVTDGCNFRCKHCYKKQSTEPCELGFDSISQFYTEMNKNGFYPNVIISGGEPLLYSELYKLLDFVPSDKKCRVNTNGAELDKHIEKFKKYHNLCIQVSLDGYDNETFFSVRNNHLFSKIIENTIRARECGLDTYFRATLTNSTITSFSKFIDLSKSTGIPITIRPFYNTGKKSQESLIVDFDNLLKWHKIVSDNDLFEYTGGKNLISENSCPLLKPITVFSALTIDNHGRVYPCQLLRSDKFYMGSIINDSFEKIFSKSQIIVDKLKSIINSSSCQKCGFRNNFGDGTCVPSCLLGNKNCVLHKIEEVIE